MSHTLLAEVILSLVFLTTPNALRMQSKVPRQTPETNSTDLVLSSVPFDKLPVVNGKSSTFKVTQSEDGLRTLSLEMWFGRVKIVQHWTTMQCGPIDPNRALTCAEQACQPSDDPMELVDYDNVRQILSVGPTVLGSRMQRAAIIGVGGGAMVHFLHRWNPDIHIDAVEYSAPVAETAKSCFAFPMSKQVHLHVIDGVSFLEQQSDSVYDLIIVDASNSMQRFATPDVHAQVLRILTPGGLYTWNADGFEDHKEEVNAALDVAKGFWKHAYYSDQSLSLTLSKTDIAAAGKEKQVDGMLDGSNRTKYQETISHWFGNGFHVVW